MNLTAGFVLGMSLALFIGAAALLSVRMGGDTTCAPASNTTPELPRYLNHRA